MHYLTPEHYQARLEVRYGIHYNAAAERLYRRLKLFSDVVSLLSGSAAVVSVVNASPTVAAGAGIVLAALAILNQLASPGEAACRFNEGYRRFTELDRRAGTLDPEQIHDAIGAIRADLPWGISALGPVAYNLTMQANGRDDCCMPLTPWQRLIACVI